MTDGTSNDSAAMVLDPETIAMLKSIFKDCGNEDHEPAMEEGFSQTASVKFMITLKDEENLRNLGYSQGEIQSMKPQEAAEILTRANLAPL